MKRLLIAAILMLAPLMAQAQGFPFHDIVLSGQGQPVAGAAIELCAPVATTAAQVVSNVAILTLVSNPVTDGFASGGTLTVSGFTGGDTYFNGSYTIISVTSSTITYALTHANASAGTNGTALQEGNASIGCAGLVPIYSDQAETLPITPPTHSDGLGNISFYATPIATAYVQVYGSSISTRFYPASIPCIPNTSCGNSGTVTSVAMTGDNVIYNTSVSGSPITTSGTLAPSLKTQAIYTVLANCTGSIAAPVFCSINNSMLPVPLNIISSASTGTPFEVSGTSLTNTAGTYLVNLQGSAALQNWINMQNVSGADIIAQMSGSSGSTSFSINSDNGVGILTIDGAHSLRYTGPTGGEFEVFCPSGCSPGGHLVYSFDTGKLVIPNAVVNAATPTGSGGQVSFGTTAGFGNGSSGTAVTTTTKSTGTGPTTPQTVVNYLQIDIAGTKYYIPLMQ